MNQELAARAIQSVDRIDSALFGEGVRLRGAKLANRHLIGCAALLFVLPNVIFASALTSLPALVLLFGCALAGVLMWRAAPGELLAKPIETKVFVGCLALAFVICLLGGET
ncbi:MAG TPA: hypothetical protein VED87_10585, partial [Methylocystis sp.]|nr:hypothetical protein [Methylocystis sp.]